MMGFIMRFFPEYRAAKRLIDAGEIGEIKNLWTRRSRRLPEQSWYRDPEQSGGVTFELGIHLIDLVRWLVPSSIQWDSAVMQGDVYRLGKEDNVWMLLEFANGAIGGIGASYSYSLEQSDFGVVGTEKSLTVDRGKGGRVIVEDYRFGRSDEHPAGPDAPDGTHPGRAELAHFVDCVRNRRSPIATGEDGAASLAVALAAVESANGAGRVAVELDSGGSGGAARSRGGSQQPGEQAGAR
jgi:UDP-N-acetylglucosamine 3-dehydrogenase